MKQLVAWLRVLALLSFVSSLASIQAQTVAVTKSTDGPFDCDLLREITQIGAVTRVLGETCGWNDYRFRPGCGNNNSNSVESITATGETPQSAARW